MLGPFPLADVLARLKAQVPALRMVGTAADLRAATEQQPNTTPAAYVVRQERARPTAGASGGVLVQIVDVDVIVINYVRNQAGAAAGSAAAAEMDALVAAERGALLNWSPAPQLVPLALNAARDESYSAGLLTSQELYRSSYRIEVRP